MTDHDCIDQQYHAEPLIICVDASLVGLSLLPPESFGLELEHKNDLRCF